MKLSLFLFLTTLLNTACLFAMDPPAAQAEKFADIAGINEVELAKTLKNIWGEDLTAKTNGRANSIYVTEISKNGKKDEITLLLAVGAALHKFEEGNQEPNELLFHALCAFYETFKAKDKDTLKIKKLLGKMSDRDDVKYIYIGLIEGGSGHPNDVKPAKKPWSPFKSSNKDSSNKLLINNRDRQNSDCGRFAQAMIILCNKYYKEIKQLPLL